MKTYVVFHIDWFNHEPKSELVSAETEVDAMRKSSFLIEYDISQWENDVDEFKQRCFDCDMMLHAHEVTVYNGRVV